MSAIISVVRRSLMLPSPDGPRSHASCGESNGGAEKQRQLLLFEHLRPLRSKPLEILGQALSLGRLRVINRGPAANPILSGAEGVWRR